MFRRITVILLLLCLFVSIEYTNAAESQTSPPVATTTNGCHLDWKESAVGSSVIALGIIAVCQICFSIVVAVVLFFILSKLSEKMREAETHLHQVMDATLCALIPQLVVLEINSIAEEAQNQNKKPKDASKKEASKKDTSKKGEENKEKEKTNMSAKSAKKEE